MAINRKKLIILRWILFLCAVMIPLCILPSKFDDMKIAVLIRENRIEDSVTFTYAGDRTIKCFTENPENIKGKTYVFLPSYADMGHIGIDVDVARVDFEKGNEIITVKAGEHIICSFEKGIPYKLHFYNSAEKELGEKEIIFLKSGNLPTMYVNTRTGSMDRLDADKKYKEKAVVELLDRNGELLYADDLKTISARGNQTFTFAKKSYQINLKNPVDFFGMGASDKWILLCNVYDPAYIRNKLTYEMALWAGMPGSSESEYIDVYFNGIYGGMYQLCEKVQIGDNRLEIADLEKQNRALNGEVLDYAEGFVSEDGKQKGTKLARNPADITGGYLIEHDYGEKFDEVVSGFITDTDEHFALKSPMHASKEQVNYISSLMQEVEDAIRAEDGYHPVTGKHFTEYIDLESWADKYIVEEISYNNGGGSTSSYFYKPSEEVSRKIFGGPVWDYDKGYGNASGFNKNTRNLGFLMLHMVHTDWFYYLYQHDEFVDAVKKEYREKFSDYLGVMVEQKADEYLEQIEEAAVPDRARFEQVYLTFGEEALDYKAQAEYVKQFIRERKNFLDEIWLEDAQVHMVHFLNEEGNGIRCLGVKDGECIGTLPDGEGQKGEFAGWKIEGSDEFLTEDMPITGEMTVRGIWK